MNSMECASYEYCLPLSHNDSEPLGAEEAEKEKDKEAAGQLTAVPAKTAHPKSMLLLCCQLKNAGTSIKRKIILRGQ